MKYRCKECNKTSTESINELSEKFSRMYKFCNGGLNKFVLLLRKGVYLYEYMDSWEKFNEASLPHKNNFLEDISDKDYSHAQKVFEEYCTDMCDYHDLYVQTDPFLLADFFEKFRDKSIEIYGFDPSYFYSAPGLAWQACLNKTLLMIEEGIRGGMCQSTHRYAKANNKYMKNYDKKI